MAGILMDMPQCAEELAGALRDSQGQLTALNAQLPGGFLCFTGRESNCCAEALWPRHFRGAHPDLRRQRWGRNLADFLPSVSDIHILARLRLTSCASSRGRARAFLRSSRSGRVGPGRFLHKEVIYRRPIYAGLAASGKVCCEFNACCVLFDFLSIKFA